MQSISIRNIIAWLIFVIVFIFALVLRRCGHQNFTRILEKPNSTHITAHTHTHPTTHTPTHPHIQTHTHIHTRHSCKLCQQKKYTIRLTSSLRLLISFFADTFLFPPFIIYLSKRTKQLLLSLYRSGFGRFCCVVFYRLPLRRQHFDQTKSNI